VDTFLDVLISSSYGVAKVKLSPLRLAGKREQRAAYLGFLASMIKAVDDPKVLSVNAIGVR